MFLKLALLRTAVNLCKTALKNGQNKDLNDKWKLNEGQNYCTRQHLKKMFDLFLPSLETLGRYVGFFFFFFI